MSKGFLRGPTRVFGQNLQLYWCQHQESELLGSLFSSNGKYAKMHSQFVHCKALAALTSA